LCAAVHVRFDPVLGLIFYKLFRATRCWPDSDIDPRDQLTFYDPGLGSQPESGVFGAERVYHWVHNLVSKRQENYVATQLEIDDSTLELADTFGSFRTRSDVFRVIAIPRRRLVGWAAAVSRRRERWSRPA
jgi:hypothetical protein